MATGRGGKRPGAGRPKGSRSAATKKQQATISDLAKQHANSAIEALVMIATSGESEAARVSAANAILDRGYGKPQQSHEHTSPDGSMSPRPAIDASKLSDAALAELDAAMSNNDEAE